MSDAYFTADTAVISAKQTVQFVEHCSTSFLPADRIEYALRRVKLDRRAAPEKLGAAEFQRLYSARNQQNCRAELSAHILMNTALREFCSFFDIDCATSEIGNA